MNMNQIKLIIFDIDGTIAEYKTGVLLPTVRKWFKTNIGEYHIAFATNQGGVGLRYWMERDSFGNPEEYPTKGDIEKHMQKVIHQLPKQLHTYLGRNWSVCFRYQSKKGTWSPVPQGCAHLSTWKQENRKPNPGMLLDAIKKRHVRVAQVLMVGNSIDDELAAENAGIFFVGADDFFERREV